MSDLLGEARSLYEPYRQLKDANADEETITAKARELVAPLEALAETADVVGYDR